MDKRLSELDALIEPAKTGRPKGRKDTAKRKERSDKGMVKSATCKYGHLKENGVCRECARARWRKWRAAHPKSPSPDCIDLRFHPELPIGPSRNHVRTPG